MTVEEARAFFPRLDVVAPEADIADKLLDEINDRLRYLNDVGLEYLTLDRLSSTLSGGEAQRIQLATSLGLRLVGTLYVLDDLPSDCIAATPHGSSRFCTTCGTWATQFWSWNTMSRSCALRRSHHRPWPGRRRKRRSPDRQWNL